MDGLKSIGKNLGLLCLLFVIGQFLGAQDSLTPEEEAFLKEEASYVARQFTDALEQLGRADVSETESKLYRMKIREMFSDDAFIDSDLLTMSRGSKVTVDDYLQSIKTSFASNGVKFLFSDIKTAGIFKGQYYFAVVTLNRQIKGVSAIDSTYIANRLPRDLIVKFEQSDGIWKHEITTYQFHEGVNSYKQAPVKAAPTTEEAEHREEIILNSKIREYEELNSQLHEIQKDLLKRYREIEGDRPSQKLSSEGSYDSSKVTSSNGSDDDEDAMLHDINSHNLYHGNAILKFAPFRLFEGLLQVGFEHRLGRKSSVEINAGWYFALPNLLYHEPMVLLDTMDFDLDNLLTNLKDLHERFDYSSLDNFTQENGLGWNLRAEMRFYSRSDLQGRYFAPRIMYKSTSWDTQERFEVSNQALSLDFLIGWQWHHRKRLHDDFYLGWGIRYVDFDNGDLDVSKLYYTNFNIGYKLGLRFKQDESRKE